MVVLLFCFGIWHNLNIYPRDATPKLPQTTVSSLSNKVKFEKKDIDFGATTLNKPVLEDFFLKNISASPLVIENVNTSCGCTTANYTKKPILPGEKGKITIIYDAGTVGQVFKSATVKFKDINEKRDLVITGEVKE